MLWLKEFFVRLSAMFFLFNIGALFGGILLRWFLVLISPEKDWTYSWAVTKTIDKVSGWYLEPGHTTLILMVAFMSIWTFVSMMDHSTGSSNVYDMDDAIVNNMEQIAINDSLDLYPVV